MNTIEYVNANRLKKFGGCFKITHEGTNQVKKSKINLLVHNYELFSMKENETIVERLLGSPTLLMVLKLWEKPTRNLRRL